VCPLDFSYTAGAFPNIYLRNVPSPSVLQDCLIHALHSHRSYVRQRPFITTPESLLPPNEGPRTTFFLDVLSATGHSADMRFTIGATTVLALLPTAFSQLATSTTSAATGTGAGAPQPTSTASAADVDAIVSFLLPSLGSTSLSPSQSAAILRDASSYLDSYTSANPLASLKADLVLDNLFASTTPSNAQIQSLSTLIDRASSGLINNPSAYVQSVESLISPFPFASKVRSYESGFKNGLATVVASDLRVTPPPPAATSASASTNVQMGAGPRATGVAGAVVGAGVVAGALGMALL
jgi:hypothetical protein